LFQEQECAKHLYVLVMCSIDQFLFKELGQLWAET